MFWKPWKPARPRKFFRIWSGRRESNPCPKLGKLLYCHCTTPALKIKLANWRGGCKALISTRALHVTRDGCKLAVDGPWISSRGSYEEQKTNYFGRCNSGPGSCSRIARRGAGHGG